MILTGVITPQAKVKTDDGTLFELPLRGKSSSGFAEVLIDATEVGGSGEFKRQSIEPYIGMKVKFVTNNGLIGYNFKIIK